MNSGSDHFHVRGSKVIQHFQPKLRSRSGFGAFVVKRGPAHGVSQRKTPARSLLAALQANFICVVFFLLLFDSFHGFELFQIG